MAGVSAAAIDGGPAVSLPAFCFDCFRRRAAACQDPGGRDPGRACLPGMEIRTGGRRAADRRRGRSAAENDARKEGPRERPPGSRNGRTIKGPAASVIWYKGRNHKRRKLFQPGRACFSSVSFPALQIDRARIPGRVSFLPADFRRDPSEDFRPALAIKNRPEILQGRQFWRTLQLNEVLDTYSIYIIGVGTSKAAPKNLHILRNSGGRDSAGKGSAAGPIPKREKINRLDYSGGVFCAEIWQGGGLVI